MRHRHVCFATLDKFVKLFIDVLRGGLKILIEAIKKDAPLGSVLVAVLSVRKIYPAFLCV
jgi:hypothetical protein